MTLLFIVLIILCILVSGFYAGAEMGFYRLNRVRLALRVRDAVHSALRLDALVKRPDEYVIMALVGQNLFVFLATLLCTELYEPVWPERAEWLATLTLVVPFFIFGEVLQKELFARSADTLMYRLAGTLALSKRLLGPVVFLLVQMQRLWKVFPRYRSAPEEFEVEWHRLFHFFSQSVKEGTFSAYQHTMAANIMTLRGLRVESKMIPLALAMTVRAGQTLEECREIARATHFRRFPVANEHGALVGVVNILDILAAQDEKTFAVRHYLRRPTVLSRSASVIDAIHLLKRSGRPMGFVEDERGDIIGIVTIKDLVEEIVGELSAW